jgi:hypothetical protein
MFALGQSQWPCIGCDVENEALTRRLNKPSALLALLCESNPTDERVFGEPRAAARREGEAAWSGRCCSSAGRLFGPIEALQVLPKSLAHSAISSPLPGRIDSTP